MFWTTDLKCCMFRSYRNKPRWLTGEAWFIASLLITLVSSFWLKTCKSLYNTLYIINTSQDSLRGGVVKVHRSFRTPLVKVICPIQLILRRLHFLVGSDKVPVEGVNSLSLSSAHLLPSFWGSNCCCYWCCYIMTTRDSLVIFLSPDESEENNTRHVSSVVSTYSCLVCFCLWFSPALNLEGFSQGCKKAFGNKGTFPFNYSLLSDSNRGHVFLTCCNTCKVFHQKAV